MKKFYVLISLLLFLPTVNFAQVIYSSRIDSIINLVSRVSLAKLDKELSGDTITSIGGVSQKIFSRWFNSPSNQLAAQYIYEKLQSYGLPSRLQYNNSHNVNVVARKTGYLNPHQKLVICAHYDNILSGTVLPTDTVYGADDNASGVVAMLEAARLLANYNTPVTIEFVAFDEEEVGLLGSIGYADSSLVSGDTIMSVLNMDMIGWDNNNDGLVRIMTPNSPETLADILINCYTKYNIPLTSIKAYNATGSDHLSFWTRGILAITSIEPANDFHQYYHTRGDIFSRINMNYFVNNTKANIAALLSLADGLIYNIYHNSLSSGMDTSGRYAGAFIYFPIPIGLGNNAARLYYKINNGSYQYVNAFQVNGFNYTFRIPGQAHGTKVSYYIAAQDSTGNYVITSPSGGSGVNPPGTTPPPTVYTYYIWASVSQSSNKIKPILDNQYLYDTIYISQQGIVEDVELNLNLNHTNDGDLLIKFIKGSENCNLSQFNGEGGQNYTNTTFDDSASVSITQGNPPFTGRFKPQILFTCFKGKQMQGYWIIGIYDVRAGNSGNLLNWSISLNYSSQVSVKKVEDIVPEKYSLRQNYPNPFNPMTNILYELPKGGIVKLVVFDLLGREVETLVNEKQNPGTYSVLFNASKYPSGIYFYRITTEEFVQTKKMIMIK